MDRTWFLRLEDVVIGPVSSLELSKLAGSGGIGPETPISSDNLNWFPAKQQRYLCFAAANYLGATIKPTKSSPIVLWIVLAGLGAGTVLFILLIGAGILLNLAASPPAATATGSTVAGPVADEIAIAQQTGRETLRYWDAVGAILSSVPNNGSSDQTGKALTGAAYRIEQIPVTTVDPIAIECALKLSRTCRIGAEVARRKSDPSALLEALARGFSGDPFGKALDMFNEDRVFQQQLIEMQTEVARTRATLSQRYGITFSAW